MMHVLGFILATQAVYTYSRCGACCSLLSHSCWTPEAQKPVYLFSRSLHSPASTLAVSPVKVIATSYWYSLFMAKRQVMRSQESQKRFAAADWNDVRPGILREGQVILNPGRRRLLGGETAIVIGTSQAAVDHALGQQFTAAPPLKAVSSSGNAVSIRASSDDIKVRRRVQCSCNLTFKHTRLSLLLSRSAQQSRLPKNIGVCVCALKPIQIEQETLQAQQISYRCKKPVCRGHQSPE